MPRITLDDSPYYRSHGKAPRGRGSWAFCDINDQRDIDAAKFFQGTYADARKQARAYFAQQANCSGIVVVLP